MGVDKERNERGGAWGFKIQNMDSSEFKRA